MSEVQFIDSKTILGFLNAKKKWLVKRPHIQEWQKLFRTPLFLCYFNTDTMKRLDSYVEIFAFESQKQRNRKIKPLKKGKRTLIG